MNPALVRLYHRMPAPARSLAASLRGRQLRAWRYGPETDALARAALDREGWSEADWEAWRRERLSALLRRAARDVPFYRDYWAGRRRSGASGAPERLEDWPVLSKSALRADPRAFLADGCDPRRMFHEHTSGTTGTPLDLWWSRRTVREWYALFEARVRGWNGVSRHDRWGMLGGQLVTPAERRRPPFWVWNGPLEQLYMSSYHLSPSTVEAYLEALARHRVRYLFGYASSLDSLAQLAEERGLSAPRFGVAISNAEPLLDHQRERIGRVFGGPARNTYGMAEIVAAASECAAGAMHAWPEVGVTELLDADGRPVPDGETGRIVATGLLNDDMPLVRYDTGDRAAAGPSAACPCGRRLPRMGEIDGRADDVLVTEDGRRIGRLDPVFKRSLAIREGQVIQEAPARLRVRLVPAEGFGPGTLQSIRDGLAERLGGGFEVTFETVDRIPRTAAGKFRAVVSEISGGRGAA